MVQSLNLAIKAHECIFMNNTILLCRKTYIVRRAFDQWITLAYSLIFHFFRGCFVVCFAYFPTRVMTRPFCARMPGSSIGMVL